MNNVHRQLYYNTFNSEVIQQLYARLIRYARYDFLEITYVKLSSLISSYI